MYLNIITRAVPTLFIVSLTTMIMKGAATEGDRQALCAAVDRSEIERVRELMPQPSARALRKSVGWVRYGRNAPYAEEPIVYARTLAIAQLLVGNAGEQIQEWYEREDDRRDFYSKLLRRACMNGETPLIKFYLEKNANPLLSEKSYGTPVQLIIKRAMRFIDSHGRSDEEMEQAADEALERIDACISKVRGGDDVVCLLASCDDASGSSLTIIEDAGEDHYRKLYQGLKDRLTVACKEYCEEAFNNERQQVRYLPSTMHELLVREATERAARHAQHQAAERQNEEE